MQSRNTVFCQAGVVLKIGFYSSEQVVVSVRLVKMVAGRSYSKTECTKGSRQVSLFTSDLVQVKIGQRSDVKKKM